MRPLFELVRLRIVLYSFEESVLWSSVATNSSQRCFCLFIIEVLICSFSLWMWSVVACECGVGVRRRLLRVLMRREISGVELGLYFFLFPLRTYFLSASVMMVLKWVRVWSMLVMGCVFSSWKRTSVSLVNSSQELLL